MRLLGRRGQDDPSRPLLQIFADYLEKSALPLPFMQGQPSRAQSHAPAFDGESICSLGVAVCGRKLLPASIPHRGLVQTSVRGGQNAYLSLASVCVCVRVPRSLGHDGRLFSICRMGQKSLRYCVRQVREHTAALSKLEIPRVFLEVPRNSHAFERTLLLTVLRTLWARAVEARSSIVEHHRHCAGCGATVPARLD